MDGRPKRQRIFRLAPIIENRTVNQNNVMSDVPMTVVERTRCYMELECKRLSAEQNSDELKRPLTSAERQRRYREQKKLLAEQNSDGNKRPLTAVVRQNHSEQKRLLAGQNSDGLKRPLTSAERQRRYREQKKLFPGQNSNGRKRPLTPAEKQRRYRERKKLLAKQKPDVCNMLLTPLEKQKNQGLTSAEKLYKFEDRLSEGVLDLCETVYINPEIHDSIKNNLTDSMLSTSSNINRTELNNEETTDSNSQSLSGLEGTQTLSVQENEIAEENNALKKRREYQQRYRKQNREKLKLREAERRRHQKNSEIISKAIIDDEIRAAWLEKMENLLVEIAKRNKRDSNIYDLCDPVNIKSELEDSITHSSTVSNVYDLWRNVNIKPEIYNSIENSLADSSMNMHGFCEIVDIKSEIDESSEHNSAGLSEYDFKETVNIKHEIDDAIENNSIENNLADSNMNMHRFCEMMDIKSEIDVSSEHNSTGLQNRERTFTIGRKLSDFDSPLEAELYFNMTQYYMLLQEQEIRRLNNRISELEAQQK